MMPHIILFNEANVETDQPWITPAEREHAKLVGDMFTHEMYPGIEKVIVDHLEQRVSEGDQKAIDRLHPFCHYILTEDFRIVQEPNFYRWGMFLERAKHRIIGRTDICDGIERDRDYFSNSWARQHRRKWRDAPSCKPHAMWVSTVFIGTGDDELFETMIFGGWLDSIRWKTSTLGEAKKNHQGAVMVSRQHKNYMKHHGRSARKDWIRMAKFWELGRKRGTEWALKHLSVMQQVENRLSKIPGDPETPQPDNFSELVRHILPREGTPI